MKRAQIILLTVFVTIFLVSCGIKSDPVLTISGLKDTSFSQKELESMPMTESSYTNKDGETTTYLGVSLNELITKEGIETYTNLNIIASDGYSVSVTFDELSVCSECVLSYSKDNGWCTIMPNFSGKLQVKDVVELSVE